MNLRAKSQAKCHAGRGLSINWQPQMSHNVIRKKQARGSSNTIFNRVKY